MTVPTGYTASVSNSGDKFTIVNKHIVIEEITKLVQKNWNDQNDKDKLRPQSIQVQLLADGEVIKTVTLDENNNWTYKWEGLAKFSNDKTIVYSVKEVNVPTDYVVTITNDGDTFVITNTLVKPKDPIDEDTNDKDESEVVVTNDNQSSFLYGILLVISGVVTRKIYKRKISS